MAVKTSAKIPAKIEKIQVQPRASGGLFGATPQHAQSTMSGSVDVRESVVYRTYALFTAGAIGGCTATYATHWLDTLKVKMQSFPETYRSATYCLKHTLKTEGVKGLYFGASPAVLACTTRAAIVFSCYGLCQEFVASICHIQDKNRFTALHHGYIGATTGLISSFVLSPIELLKCRLQAIHQVRCTMHLEGTVLTECCGPIPLTRHILRSEGLTGMFCGLSNTCMKMVPMSFIYFGSYEQSKSVCRHWQEKDVLDWQTIFVCGGVAGLCSSVIFPLDVLKTRIQVMSPVSGAKGVVGPLKMALQQEGIRPLYSGLRPFLLRACLFSAIQLLVFEQCKKALIG